MKDIKHIRKSTNLYYFITSDTNNLQYARHRKRIDVLKFHLNKDDSGVTFNSGNGLSQEGDQSNKSHYQKKEVLAFLSFIYLSF
jgi:hypothetical protein